MKTFASFSSLKIMTREIVIKVYFPRLIMRNPEIETWRKINVKCKEYCMSEGCTGFRSAKCKKHHGTHV